jgi:hypothetical protein
VPIVRLNEFLSDTQQIGQGVAMGQAGWEQVLENNKQAFTAEFVQRSRFTSAFPTSMTPAQFVDTLNANARSPLSASERNQGLRLLADEVESIQRQLRQCPDGHGLHHLGSRGIPGTADKLLAAGYALR